MFFDSTRLLPHGQAERKLRTKERLRLVHKKVRFFRRNQISLCSTLILASICGTLGIRAQTLKDSIDVPTNSSLLLEAKGTGVQVYGCLGGKWTLQAPDATLLDRQGNVIGTHYAGPTWRLNDGSWVRANPVAKRASPDGVSVPWLLLESAHGTGSLATVEFIQRTDTHGGNAPSETCSDGAELRVPYTATYLFYKTI
jgi:hypothetical protein